MNSDKIEDWDSLNHIILIVEIEKKLPIDLSDEKKINCALPTRLSL